MTATAHTTDTVPLTVCVCVCLQTALGKHAITGESTHWTPGWTDSSFHQSDDSWTAFPQVLSDERRDVAGQWWPTSAVEESRGRLLTNQNLVQLFFLCFSFSFSRSLKRKLIGSSSLCQCIGKRTPGCCCCCIINIWSRVKSKSHLCDYSPVDQIVDTQKKKKRWSRTRDVSSFHTSCNAAAVNACYHTRFTFLKPFSSVKNLAPHSLFTPTIQVFFFQKQSSAPQDLEADTVYKTSALW